MQFTLGLGRSKNSFRKGRNASDKTPAKRGGLEDGVGRMVGAQR